MMEIHYILSWFIFVGATVDLSHAEKTEEDTAHDDFICPKDWISDATGKCYRLHTAVKTPNVKRIRQAAKVCAKENATLAHVRYMRDRLFLSELFQQWHPDVDTWYVGGKRKNGKWYGVTLVEKKLRRSKRRRTNTNQKRRRRTLAIVKTKPISDEFLNLDNGITTQSTGCHRRVLLPCGRANFLTLSNRKTACSRACDFLGGYYWRAAWSFSRAGLNFVCEKKAEWSPKLPEGVCGQSVGQSPTTNSLGQFSIKIAGGNPAPYGKHSWQAGVKRVNKAEKGGKQTDDVPFCGATIINEFWLLSVAHCYRNGEIEDMRVIIGKHSLEEKDAGEEIFEIEAIIPHENFTHGARDGYDISLIKIKPRANGTGMIFNRYVQPACLPTPHMPHVDGQRCYITGWGSLGGNDYPSELMEAQVPLVKQEVCENLMTGNTQNRTLCAGDLDQFNAWRSACQGDSGGPLVCEYQGAQTVVGITSWGHFCDAFPPLKIYMLDSGGFGFLVYPGVFTRVQSFLPWVEKTMERHSSSLHQMELPRRPN